jgi:protein-tyrosine-phosphatase
VQTTDEGDQSQLSPAPTRLLFVCQSHTVLSPMAEALARRAYRRLNIYVHSAGLQRGAAKLSAVTALSEIGIGLDRTAVTGVQDVELSSFDLLVTLGVPRLGHHAQQMSLGWDDPVLLQIDGRSPLGRVRLARDGLLQRIRALGAILSTTNRA